MEPVERQSSLETVATALAQPSTGQRVRRPGIYVLSFIGYWFSGLCGCCGGVVYLGGLIAEDWTDSGNLPSRIASTTFFALAIVTLVCACAFHIISRVGINLSTGPAAAVQPETEVTED